MPDTLRHQNISPEPVEFIDSAAVSSGANDSISVRPYPVFRPAYYNNFNDVSYAPVVQPAKDYVIAVVPPPQGLLGEKKVELPAHNSGVALLLVCSFLLVGTAYRSGVLLFGQMLKLIFNFKNPNETSGYNNTISESKLYFFLLLQTFVLEGITLYYAQHHFWFKIPAVGQFPIIASLSFLMLFYFVFMLILYRFLGYIFFEGNQIRQCIEYYFSINALLGVALFPILLLMIYVPRIIEECLVISLIFYILSRIIFILKSIRIFLKDIYGVVYFILYLCALEIAPLILLFNGVEFLCNFVELKIL